MASKAKKIINGCQQCGGNAYEIYHKDNHGMEELLETHCNQCGWCIDAEGIIRNQGRNLENQRLKSLERR